ncbi:MAG TPA: secretin N-terminal domain-containing protein [Steroidobacteraceae bacterium]
MKLQSRAWKLWRSLAVVVALLPGLAARADSLETLTLQHRLAEDLIPILQPLVPASAAITGAGNVLLVRADEATLAQVRAAVAALDRAPRQLLITVGQVTALDSSDRGVRGSGTVSAGNVQVGVNQPPQAPPGAQVVLRGSTTQDRIQGVSSVRALEGYEAYVTVGQSRPFTSSAVMGTPHGGTVVSQSTAYRDVQSGFYATPRLSGDRVTLDISPVQQQVTPGRHDSVSTQSVTTTVSGRLGEWIELGGTSTNRDGTGTGLVTWGTRSELTQYSAWVKVEEVR